MQLVLWHFWILHSSFPSYHVSYSYDMLYVSYSYISSSLLPIPKIFFCLLHTPSHIFPNSLHSLFFKAYSQFLYPSSFPFILILPIVIFRLFLTRPHRFVSTRFLSSSRLCTRHPLLLIFVVFTPSILFT